MSKFKKGDYIVVIDTPDLYYFNTTLNGKVKKGDIFKVDDIDKLYINTTENVRFKEHEISLADDYILKQIWS